MRIRLANLLVASSVFGVAILAACSAAQADGSVQGVGGAIPAYYDHNLLTINLTPLSAGSTLLAKNGQTNNIWFSTATPGGQPFVAVIDAIPTDGFNPLWAGNTITFNAGVTPFQLFSDNDVAAALTAGQITVTPTGVLFRCAVIGKPSASLTGAPGDSGPARQSSSWSRIRATYR